MVILEEKKLIQIHRWEPRVNLFQSVFDYGARKKEHMKKISHHISGT